MTITKRLTSGLFAGIVSLLVLACTSQQEAVPFTPPEPTQAPDIAATVTARDRDLPQGGPTATPVPASVSQAAGEFASSYDSLSRQWDALHRDMDAWRQGLASCDASSARVALREFAGDFSAVSRSAGGLSRHAMVREMSDQLTRAAQMEEAALRRLRDTWQPGQPMPAPFGGNGNGEKDQDAGNGMAGAPPQPGFEGVAQARADALTLRQGAADRLSDLQDITSVDAEAQVAEFATAFDALSAQWDQFHSDYDAFRAAHPALSPEDSLAQLNRLVKQHREIVLAQRNLPSGANSRYASDLLASAARDEDSALRRLRGSFQQDGQQDAGPGTDGASSGSPPTTEEKKEGGEPGMEGTPTPTPESNGATAEEVPIQAGDPGLFDAFDEQLALTGQARREAALALDGAVSQASAASRTAVAGFALGYDGLTRRWNGFHDGYDNWMATEGGCDRAAVTGDIGGFALRMGEIASAARQLPRAAPLRSLGELTVEAAQREEDALRALRAD